MPSSNTHKLSNCNIIAASQVLSEINRSHDRLHLTGQNKHVFLSFDTVVFSFIFLPFLDPLPFFSFRLKAKETAITRNWHLLSNNLS